MSAHVVVHPSGHDIFVDGADTILDAALRAGLSISYGCSSGNCGLCMARIVSGQVQRARHHITYSRRPRSSRAIRCSALTPRSAS